MIANFSAWLSTTSAAQDALPAHEEPVLTRAAIEGKLLPIKSFVTMLGRRPKPVPKFVPLNATRVNATFANATNSTSENGTDANATEAADDETAGEGGEGEGAAADGANAEGAEGADAEGPAEGEAEL